MLAWNHKMTFVISSSIFCTGVILMAFERFAQSDILGAIFAIFGFVLACFCCSNASTAIKSKLSQKIKLSTGALGGHDKFQAIIDDIHDGVIYVNEKGEYGHLNKIAWENHPERSNPQMPQLLVGMTPRQVHEKIKGLLKNDGSDKEILPKILQNNVEATYVPIFDKENKYRGFVEVSKDVGERLRLEKQIHRSERLAIVGELAAGVAHEINNPLDGLQNSIRLLRKNPDNKEQHEVLLPMMAEALDRIEFIVRKLLTFSRKQPLKKEIVSISHLISDSLDFVNHKIHRQNIELHYQAPEASIVICADERQISQAIINILLNAIDSMKSGGELTILVASNNNYKNEMVEITIKDTGSGIPEKTLPKIFDPFFTTKKDGYGTGLGLSVSQNMVKEHGGEIEVESTEDKGSTFVIRIPRKDLDNGCDDDFFD